MPTMAPIVKIELEHMRHTLIHSLGLHANDMQAQINYAVDRAFDSFDYDAEIALMANKLLADSFSKGLQDVFRSIRWDQAMRAPIYRLLANQFAKMAEKAEKELQCQSPETE